MLFRSSVIELSATGLDPCQPNPGEPSAPAGCDTEAALLVTLDPGAYTAILRGASAGLGVGLVEANETPGAALGSTLINISTRGTVLTGDDVRSEEHTSELQSH